MTTVCQYSGMERMDEGIGRIGRMGPIMTGSETVARAMKEDLSSLGPLRDSWMEGKGR